MRGRALLAGLLGLLGGAAGGLLLAMLVVYLWFEVFHLPPIDDDPKPGIAMLGGIVPIAVGIGSLAGAIGMVRRVRSGRDVRRWSMAFAVTIAVVLVGLALIVS